MAFTVTIITSTEDIASQTIRAQLLANFPFKSCSPQDVKLSDTPWNSAIVPRVHTLTLDDPTPVIFILIDVEVPLIRLDDHLTAEEMFGDVLMFASRHQAKSDRPALLCHTPGNLSADNSVGGDPFRVSCGSALLLHYFFTCMQIFAQQLGYGHPINHEVTHHGPTRFHQPLAFIELGSTAKEWTNALGAQVIAESIIHTGQQLGHLHFMEDSKSWKIGEIIPCVGFGGGHYMPSFTPLLDHHYAFAHVVPKYKVMDLTADMIAHIQERSLEPIKFWVIDWKGLKSAEKHYLLPLLEATDIPIKKTKALRAEFRSL